MSALLSKSRPFEQLPQKLPTHLDLPSSDGLPVNNAIEHPQSALLTETILPVLKRLYGENYFIGADVGIYYEITPDPLRGCKSPDWYYVPNVPPTLDGRFRMSYVLWQEHAIPPLVLEYLSVTGGGERDRTPGKGKLWIYEKVIRAPYYGIFDVLEETFELYRLRRGKYVKQKPDAKGLYAFEPLGAKIGLWWGQYQTGVEHWYLRWFDKRGRPLPTDAERSKAERQRLRHMEALKEDADRLRIQAEKEKEKAQEHAKKLAARLRALGLDPDAS